MKANKPVCGEHTLSRFQKRRKTILFLWIIAIPFVFGWFSPVVTVISGIQKTINLAMIIFVVWFISSLFLGRVYCSYACPFGAGQEAFGAMMSKPLLNSRSRKKRRIARYIIFIIWLSAILIIPFTDGGFKEINPYLSGNLQSGGSLATFHADFTTGMIFYYVIQLVAFIILTLWLGNRAGCNYGCPMSVIGDLGTRIKNKLGYPSLHLEMDAQACNHCKKCVTNCQMSIGVEEYVMKGRMDDPDCILCGACVDSCPKQAIRYAWRWNR